MSERAASCGDLTEELAGAGIPGLSHLWLLLLPCCRIELSECGMGAVDEGRDVTRGLHRFPGLGNIPSVRASLPKAIPTLAGWG